ncbi:papilin-like isoform X3 [Sycon ciliatum]|uniref:papilin-like isoform X3 n=1 Tax=Sycon ciliatum TaxID=27933 RepID=UPI0031F7141E
MDLRRSYTCVVVLVIAVSQGLAAASAGWTACGAIGGKQVQMKLFTDEKNFADSQNHCAQLGGNLSTVQTDVERKCADSAITTCAACTVGSNLWCDRTCRVWVGLQKRTGRWKWLTHATSLSKWQLKWRSGEPTDDDYQKCGYQYKELSGLGDYSCNNQLSYLCQRYRPVDGAWSTWTGYGSCSSVSGGCSKTRNRTCTNPPPTNGGGSCTGMSQQFQTCNCAVNGGWSSWTSYGHCFGVSGGRCSIQRHRTCTNPTPSNGGAQCTGDSLQLMTCSCPVDGRWSTWTAIGTCSVSCGSGNQIRVRSCNSPPPAHGGRVCSGQNRQTVSCQTNPCPINGKWSQWSAFSQCSKTCGGAQQTRKRTCTSPSPAHGGYDCSGISSDTRSCGPIQCPIDGAWSSWSSYTQCSKTCQGTHTRTRSCTNPSPAFNGTECIGGATYTNTCGATHCPVNGKWSAWSSYTACSATCEGKKSRFRSCTNPAPEYQGSNCSGSSTEDATCGATHCPVDGKWSPWSAYGPCSGTCEGHKNRARTCRNPRPAYNGQPCQGNNSQTLACGTSNCPVDGHWSQWSPYSQCNATCEGTQVRNRSCNSPVKAYGGKPCLGNSTQQQRCGKLYCPVKGDTTTKVIDPQRDAGAMEPAEVGSSTGSKSSSSTFVGLGASIGIGVLLVTVAVILWKKDMLPMNDCLAKQQGGRNEMICNSRSERSHNHEPSPVPDDSYAAIGADLLNETSFTDTYDVIGNSTAVRPKIKSSGPGKTRQEQGTQNVYTRESTSKIGSRSAEESGGDEDHYDNIGPLAEPPQPVQDENCCCAVGPSFGPAADEDEYDNTHFLFPATADATTRTRQEQRTQNIYTRESTSKIGSRSAEETGGDEDHYDNIGLLAESPQPVEDENYSCAVGPSFGPAADEDEYDNTHFLFPATADATTRTVNGEESNATYDTLQSWPLPETTEQAASTTYDTLCRGDNIQGAQDDPALANSTVYEAVEAHPKGIGGDGLANPLYDSMLPCTIAATSAHGTSISVSIPGDTIFDETIYDNTLLPAEF